MTDFSFDIAIIGAGMAGLACARKLHQCGFKVGIIDKSRGLGGRMATRRLHGTHADHGVCYLKPKDPAFRSLLDSLVDRGTLHAWTDQIHNLDVTGTVQPPSDRSTRYASPTGISAIAKALATDLTIVLNQRVTRIDAIDSGWKLQTEDQSFTAKAVVVAIPAPQAVDLLETLPIELEVLRSIEFAPCITAIAVYSSDRQADAEQLNWQGIMALSDPAIGWIGLDSSKQLNPTQPAIVVQSNAAFAHEFFESPDLQTVGEKLLARAAEVTAPWLTQPEILQVHRWRYAFAINPLPRQYLAANSSAPLVFAGDWCGGNRVESAFQSGEATADWLMQAIANR